MTYNHQAQQRTNREAMTDPQPGDYWHEMLCPYFMVTHVQGDRVTVLNCMDRHGISAWMKVDQDHWTFDVSKAIQVDRQWIADRVQYGSIEGFVADVVRGREKHMAIVHDWITHHGKQLVRELQSLGPEVSRQLLMEQWK
jgi:hypothetical protein